MNIIDEKPSLFEKSVHTIWTDPHIQREMLKKHLDLRSDAASRREESVLKVVEFIDRHARSRGRLLDLGCGPGLYTSRLADKGYRVTGMDFNRASVEYAVGQRRDVEYILGDYLEDYPVGQYDAVTMIYCDLGTHSDCDRDRLLEHVHRSLSDGGIFIFDVFSEGIVHDRQEGRSWEYMPSGGFWSAGEYLLLSRTFHYPDANVFAYCYNLLSGETARRFVIWEKYYSEAEITAVLERAGFRKITIYKDLLGRNDFTSSSEMFVVAEKTQ